MCVRNNSIKGENSIARLRPLNSLIIHTRQVYLYFASKSTHTTPPPQRYPAFSTLCVVPERLDLKPICSYIVRIGLTPFQSDAFFFKAKLSQRGRVEAAWWDTSIRKYLIAIYITFPFWWYLKLHLLNNCSTMKYLIGIVRLIISFFFLFSVTAYFLHLSPPIFAQLPPAGVRGGRQKRHVRHAEC